MFQKVKKKTQRSIFHKYISAYDLLDIANIESTILK